MDEDSETLYRVIELFDAAEEEFWDQFHASDGAEVTLETPEELSRLLGNQKLEVWLRRQIERNKQ